MRGTGLRILLIAVVLGWHTPPAAPEDAPKRRGPKTNISVHRRTTPETQAPPEVAPAASDTATADAPGGAATVDAPTSAAPWHEGLFPPATIYIEPVVLPKQQDRDVLEAAAAQVAAVLEVPVRVRLPEPPRPDIPNELGAPYRVGDRLLFPPIAAAMQYIWRRDPGLPDALAIVAVSGAPLGFPTRDGRIVESATWSMRGQGIAAVSLPLLLEDLSGAAVPADHVRDRLAKAMTRMIGQALGLREGGGILRPPPTFAALDTMPLTITDATRAELRVLRALCALADGRANADTLEEAVAVRADAGDAAAAALLAILLERRDAPQQAARALDIAMDALPQLPRLYLTRARLAYRAGEWAAAADAWDHVVRLDPHAMTWAGSRPVDWLLTHQGLAARDDGAARPTWREPVDRAQAALEIGHARKAADAAREALARELSLAAQDERALFAGRDGRGLSRPSAIGLAAAVYAVAAVQLDAWDDTAEALALAEEHLPPEARAQLEHVRLRLAVGRDQVAAWRSADRSAWPDRLRTGLEARREGDVVRALDAWAPLLGALDSAWAPNVPAVDLAQLYAANGDVSRARDVVARAARAGQVADEARVVLAGLPPPPSTRAAPPLPGRVRRYAMRRFRPAIAATPTTVWFGTSDGLLRVDRESGHTAFQHVVHGLPAGAITAIATQADTLWLGTTAGLFRQEDAGSWTAIHDAGELPVPGVTALLPLGEDGMLVGTVAGICRVSAGGTARWARDLPRSRVAALAMRDGVVAASLTRFGPATRIRGAWHRVTAPSPVASSTRFGGIALDEFRRMTLTQSHNGGTTICRETPFAVYCDDLPAGTAVVGPVGAADGRLWLAAGREAAQWDHATGWLPIAALPDDDAGPILALLPDVLDGVWVVTAQTAYLLREGRFEPHVHFAPRTSWQFLVPDPRGGVWKIFSRTLDPPVGVDGPRTLPPGGIATDSHSVVLDETGSPWTMADGRLYRARGVVWNAVADLPSGAAGLRLEAVHGDVVWASDAAGVRRWSADTGWTSIAAPADALPDAPRVRGVAVAQDGRVWVAWVDRVQQVAPEMADAAALPRRTILGLAASGPDVWVATAHDGVYRLGAAPGHWTRTDGLPDSRIVTIAADGNAVWAAGADGGVARWDGTRWVRHHAGNLAAALQVDTIIPTADGGVWFQVGTTWYEHLPDPAG